MPLRRGVGLAILAALGISLAVAVAVAVAVSVGEGALRTPPHHQTPPVPDPGAMLVRGRLEPLDGVISVGVFSAAPTVALGEVRVAQGDLVEPGQVLATLRNLDRATTEVGAAQAALDLAERRLDQVRRPWRDAALRALAAAVDARRAELDLAQQQMRRTADLQRAGVRADAERDTREAELRRAISLLREAEAQLAAATGVPETEIRVSGVGAFETDARC